MSALGPQDDKKQSKMNNERNDTNVYSSVSSFWFLTFRVREILLLLVMTMWGMSDRLDATYVAWLT
eukprot:2195427-Amphidinium_carterae.1